MKFDALFLVFCLPSMLAGQQLSQYFDGNDTVPDQSLQILIDTTDTNNVWQIGLPQKIIFDSASTVPNALLTDTASPYPINDTSQFTLGFTHWFEQEMNWGIFALHWYQKLDLEHKKDGGFLEFSVDSGITWTNAFDNPYIYNLYGFDMANVDTLPNDSMGFTGTDSTWKDIWLCIDISWWYANYTEGQFKVRFSLLSDSMQTDQEGWMIDNMVAHVTFVHTVGEKEQENYLEVYPNPTNGRVYIEAKKQRQFHIIEQLEVFNTHGQLVRSYTNVPTKFFVDLDDQPPGTYYVRVQTNLETNTIPVVLQGN